MVSYRVYKDPNFRFRGSKEGITWDNCSFQFQSNPVGGELAFVTIEQDNYAIPSNTPFAVALSVGPRIPYLYGNTTRLCEHFSCEDFFVKPLRANQVKCSIDVSGNTPYEFQFLYRRSVGIHFYKSIESIMVERNFTLKITIEPYVYTYGLIYHGLIGDSGHRGDFFINTFHKSKIHDPGRMACI